MGGREISLVIRQPFCPVSGEEMNHLDLFSGPGEQALYLQTFFSEGTAGMGFEIFLECSRLLTRAKCDSGFYPPRSILCCVRTGTFVVFVQAGFKIVGETSVASTRLYQAFQDVNVVEAFQFSFSRLACQGEVRSDTYLAVITSGPASTRSTPWQSSICASLRTKTGGGGGSRTRVRKTST